MTTYNLLLLPGDGIGPEVMGEVERIVGWINAQGLATINTETDLVGGCAYDAHGEAISDATMKKGARRRRGDARRRRRAEMGWRALREAPRSGAAPLAQGSRAVRQSPPRHLLSRARRRLIAQARARRRSRHHDRARADRAASISASRRRSPISEAARSAPSTRRSTRPMRSSASPPSPSSWRASAATSCTPPRSAT